MKKLLGTFLLASSICLVTNTATVNAAKIKKTTVKPKVYISSIKDINTLVNQGTKIVLPKTVKAYMSNKTYKNVIIKWSTFKPYNKTTKKIYYRGTVSGYNKKVNLVLTIKTASTKPDDTKTATIKSIDNLEVAINAKDTYKLPDEVLATYSDGSKKNVKVKWSTETVDTSKAGTFDFEGTVEGFSGKIALKLKINEASNPGNNTNNGGTNPGNTMTDAQKQTLVNASSKLSNIVNLTNNADEKNLIIQAKSIIDNKINNPNTSAPDKTTLMTEYNKLADYEKADLMNIVLSNMDMNSINEVKSIFFGN